MPVDIPSLGFDSEDEEEEEIREKVKFSLKKLVRLLHVPRPVALVMALVGKK